MGTRKPYYYAKVIIVGCKLHVITLVMKPHAAVIAYFCFHVSIHIRALVCIAAQTDAVPSTHKSQLDLYLT